jgi:hypothetical protein
MTPDTAAELARILRLPDPPPAPVRRCAWSGCDEPLVRRPGELPNEFDRRTCCCADHGRRRCGELCRGKVYRFGPRGTAP